MFFIKKDNKSLYIILGVYIFLVFVFYLMINGFFVKPKAYRGNFQNIVINGTNPYNGGGEVEWNVSCSNTTDAIFISSNNVSNNVVNKDGVYLFTNIPNNGLIISRNIIKNNGVGWYSEDKYFIRGLNSSEVLGYENNYVCYFYLKNSVSDIYGQEYINSFMFKNDIEYVSSSTDVKNYFDGDDSVVNLGDPYDEQTNVDSQIPTPQKVAVYKDSSSPSLVWSNPKGVANNDNIKVRIEWKPVITLTHGLYDVNSIIDQDYELLYYDSIGDYNSFCTLNNNGSPPPNVLNSYNTIYDSKVLFSGTGAQQSNDWANYYIVKNNVDWVSRVDPFGTNDIFGKGTYSGVRIPDLKYRIRYETETGVSDWIYSDREFDSDNVSGPSQHSSTHSRNASGEPVSNPTYTPNNDNKVIPQNEVDNQNDSDQKKSNSIFDFISGFFDTIISAITAIFEKLKELVDSISNGTGSFFSFFGDLFGAFPQLLGIFLLGLVVTVLLRILGR